MIFSARDKDMAVDVSQDKTNKNRLILWNQHGEINQRFFIKMFNGKYAIFSAANGGTVEIPNGATQDGVNVQVNQPNKTPNEFWDISPIQGENHAYHIRSFCGKSLDLFEGSTSSNTPIIQWQFHGKKNQICTGNGAETGSAFSFISPSTSVAKMKMTKSFHSLDFERDVSLISFS